MSHHAGPGNKAVFVDHSGHRRKIMLVSGVGVAAVLFVLIVTLVNGMVSGTRLPEMIGWPGKQAGTDAVPPAPSASPSSSAGELPPTRVRAVPVPTRRSSPRPSPSATPSPRATKPSATPSPSPSATEPGEEPSASPSPSPEPTSSGRQNPGRGDTAPGRVKKSSET